MSKTITLRVEDSKYLKFKKHAESQNRSLSNFIETATMCYIDEIDFIDDFELSEIVANDSLLKKMKKGSQDARKGRGHFV